MSAEPLPRIEWDFDSVPKEELIACGYWEYARESVFIQQTYERCSEDPKSVREDMETIWSIGRPAELWFEDEESIHRCGFPKPWQSLSADTRKELVETLLYRPHAIEIQTCASTAKKIFQQAETHARESSAWFKKALQGKNIRPLITRKDDFRPSIYWAHGAESFIVDIAWKHYNNEELVQAFRKWVGKARPQHMKKPRRAGHQLRHWRVALRRLGIMRLNYHCTRHRLSTWCPAAWERFRDYYKEWYEAPGEAQRFFHKLFPFSYEIFDDPIHFRPKRKGKRCIIWQTVDGKVKTSP